MSDMFLGNHACYLSVFVDTFAGSGVAAIPAPSPTFAPCTASDLWHQPYNMPTDCACVSAGTSRDSGAQVAAPQYTSVVGLTNTLRHGMLCTLVIL